MNSKPMVPASGPAPLATSLLSSRIDPITALVGLAFAAVLAAGCGGKPGGTQLVCDPPCPQGSVCSESGCVAQEPPADMSAGAADLIEGACSPPCSGASSHCAPGGTCVPCLTNEHCPEGQVCRTSEPITICVPGCSGDARCGGGAKMCCGGQCTDSSTDTRNCGACGVVCDALHAAATCVDGACTTGSCLGGWADCNHDPSDGCEVNVHADPKNCGGCGTVCALPNAVTGCSNTCYVAGCQFGFDDCNGDTMDGCEVKVLQDVKNCGGCGRSCPAAPHARSTCINASCQLTSCDVGFADCDANPANGCETAVNADVRNCGKCGNDCGQGQVCVNGGCTCQQCNIANAKTKCVNLQCVFDSCVQGFADCDNNVGNGCETDTTGDPKNCGACGNACPMNMPGCGNGVCTNLKCSDVAIAYCNNKGWMVAPWNSAFPNQPGGAIYCVAKGNQAGADCDTCNTYSELVWKDVAQDACNSHQKLVPGKAYGGHSPCACQPNLLDCGNWPMNGCVPD